ncbi:hypothetical protein BEN74_17945 [Acinetobacter sp. WCHAc010034]|uniref:hypothetical protein n=1 Tax=Acinetobacter sp. WCHAc010034 TaxID=1879049 RepID=UPI00083AC1D6|nr:hypothetical protein [Acinetobacter sp. WCHAc010034]AYA04484.1 hypothetical protein BEN74_17945 [Acinetobacter sp. WCHAc010034]
MEIDFKVKSVSGLIGSLNIQIIPTDLNRNASCLNSIVINEVAFSLVENFFNRNKEEYFHWGNTYISSETIGGIVKDLYYFHSFIAKSNKFDRTLKLIFSEETEFFDENFLSLKPKVLIMISEIINFLENIENQKDGITVLGV